MAKKATVTVNFDQHSGGFRATYRHDGVTITESHDSLAYLMENLRNKVKEYKSLEFDRNNEATMEVDW